MEPRVPGEVMAHVGKRVFICIFFLMLVARFVTRLTGDPLLSLNYITLAFMIPLWTVWGISIILWIVGHFKQKAHFGR